MSIVKANKWQDTSGNTFQSIVQVYQATKRDTFSTTASGNTNITGLEVSITPRFATSKILVMYSINYDANRPNSGGGFRITRNSNIITDSEGISLSGLNFPVNADFGKNTENDQSLMHRTGIYLDSPATTSTLTYRIAVWKDSGFTFWCNRGAGGPGADDPSTISHITVMEVAQ